MTAPTPDRWAGPGGANGTSTTFDYNGAMKFQSLAIGQKFLWNGEIWVKTSPLVADRYESDVQKLVPRYVEVVPLPENPPPATEPPEPPDPEQVRAAFDHFYGRALTLLESELETELQQRLERELDNLRREFMRHIDGGQ